MNLFYDQYFSCRVLKSKYFYLLPQVGKTQNLQAKNLLNIQYSLFKFDFLGSFGWVNKYLVVE